MLDFRQILTFFATHHFPIRKSFLRGKMRFIGSLAISAFSAISSFADDAASYQLTHGALVAPFDQFRECAQCPEMIALPTGTFMMGAVPGESRNPFDVYGDVATGRIRNPDETNIIPHEHPRHQVIVNAPFALSRNEITYQEWEACVQENACSHRPEHRVLTLDGWVSLGPSHPVINVSFEDASEYSHWLNTRLGTNAYRLPTEAEWEYAARAGTNTPFAQGISLNPRIANFSRRATENLLQIELPDLVERDKPVAVDELDAGNPWGLRHMSGNVGEITLSCWSNTHLGLTTTSEYLSFTPLKEDCSRIVAKGGSFSFSMDHLRLAARIRPKTTARQNNLGFRVLRELQR